MRVPSVRLTLHQFLEVLAAQPRDRRRIPQHASSAVNVARTTLCGLADPSDLVSTL